MNAGPLKHAPGVMCLVVEPAVCAGKVTTLVRPVAADIVVAHVQARGIDTTGLREAALAWWEVTPLLDSSVGPLPYWPQVMLKPIAGPGLGVTEHDAIDQGVPA